MTVQFRALETANAAAATTVNAPAVSGLADQDELFVAVMQDTSGTVPTFTAPGGWAGLDMLSITHGGTGSFAYAHMQLFHTPWSTGDTTTPTFTSSIAGTGTGSLRLFANAWSVYSDVPSTIRLVNHWVDHDYTDYGGSVSNIQPASVLLAEAATLLTVFGRLQFSPRPQLVSGHEHGFTDRGEAMPSADFASTLATAAGVSPGTIQPPEWDSAGRGWGSWVVALTDTPVPVPGGLRLGSFSIGTPTGLT